MFSEPDSWTGPHGLTMRMAAISTETAKIEKRGKIRMPNDST